MAAWLLQSAEGVIVPDRTYHSYLPFHDDCGGAAQVLAEALEEYRAKQSENT